MVVVVGGQVSGKRTYVRSLGYADADMADGVLDERPVLVNLQDYIAKCPDDLMPEDIADSLAGKEVVISCEIGNGIVPLDATERALREQVGRTLNVLAARADSVVRMVCGIPVVLK